MEVQAAHRTQRHIGEHPYPCRADRSWQHGWWPPRCCWPSAWRLHRPTPRAKPPWIYLTDPGNGRIVRLADLSGAGWTTLSMQSAAPGAGRQFAFQSGIALDASGRIYFSDVTNARIVRVDNITGAGWVTFGNRGTGRNQFDLPAGVLVDGTGRIYIADASNARIVRINDMSGAGWTALGSRGAGPSQFNFPQGVAVDGAGRIYVADALNDRIVRINDMTGTGWTTFGTLGAARGSNSPRPWRSMLSRVYATDSSNDRVRISEIWRQTFSNIRTGREFGVHLALDAQVDV
jgi:streptogramin lyase